MRHIFTLCWTAVLLVLFVCCEKHAENQSDIRTVTFTLPEIVNGDSVDTKTYLDQSTNDILWDVRDTVGIYPDTGNQISFSMAHGAGTRLATLDGGGWALKSSSTYYCYYPFIGDMYLSKDHMPVTFVGQEITSIDATDYMGSHTYMAASGVSPESGKLEFNFKNLTCFIRITATLPAGTYSSLSLCVDDKLFVSDGYYDLTAQDPEIVGTRYSKSLKIGLNNARIESETTFKVYLMSAPVDLRGHEIRVRVSDADGNVLECLKSTSKEYVSGKTFGLACSAFTPVSADPDLDNEDLSYEEF